MKKIFALLFVAFIALNASAQAPATDSWKPQQGDIGFTFGLSGLANIGVTDVIPTTGTLLFRYYIANDMAIRVGINVAPQSHTAEQIDSAHIGGERGTTDNKVVTKSSSWGINLGIQKSFGSNAKLEPYVGVDLWVGGSKSGKIDTTSNTNVSSAGNNSIATSYTSSVAPGSTFTFGVTPLVGFNWFIGKQFAIGAEFGWGLFISSTPAGTFTNTSTSSETTAGTVTTTPAVNGSSNLPSSKSTTLGTHGTGLITCSVFFNP